MDDAVLGRLSRNQLKDEFMKKIPSLEFTGEQLAAAADYVQAYLVLTLAPLQIGNAGPMTVVKGIAVYSEPWPTSLHGQVHVVMRAATGPYHLAGEALDQWAKDHLHESLKPFYNPRSWK